MAELKTKKTVASVSAFLDQIADADRRKDCKAIAALMKKATGAAPKMWGSSIVGFGDRHLKYESGRELDWFVVGFSPRAANLTLYLQGGVNQSPALLKKLGKYSTGKGCLYIKRLADVDMSVLQKILEESVRG